MTPGIELLGALPFEGRHDLPLAVAIEHVGNILDIRAKYRRISMQCANADDQLTQAYDHICRALEVLGCAPKAD